VAKVLVSLDDRLLGRIDVVARSRGLSRSAYLARLAERDVGLALPPGQRSEVRRALRRLDVLMETHKPRTDSTSDVRAERDAR
jgi:hypothetical protein